MTRFLSSVLGAQQPLFSQSILELERASGRPSADIRLTTEIMQRARAKIAALGLDPKDTTGPELYAALHDRLLQDEKRLRAALGLAFDAPTGEVLAKIQKFLDSHNTLGMCFALKATSARRLFKKKAPKTAMKLLGYRSLDSMLKHEPMPNVYAAATMVETDAWHRTFRLQYTTLTPRDFEQRRITITHPRSKRWADATEGYVGASKQNILCFKELGAVILLPHANALKGLAITSLLLALHYTNDIRAYSSFTKLEQVKPDFGAIIQETMAVEPMTAAHLAGQPVPWKVIQRYYGRRGSVSDRQPLAVFEPQLQSDDLQWHDGEKLLAELEPALDFWLDTQYVCTLHANEPVSLNILDVALASCNRLSFADRIVHFAREHLWHELMSRYLHQENLETAVHQQLARQLVDESATLA